MDEFSSEDDDNSIDEIMNILSANGIKIVNTKKKQTCGIKILEDVLIYKPDEEFLKKINENVPPENPDILCIPSCSTTPISTEERTSTTRITNTSTHFVIETETETDHLADSSYIQALTHTEECFTTAMIADTSPNINTDVMATDSDATCCDSTTSEDRSTTSTAEIHSSYVVGTNAEVIAVPSCSNISTSIEAPEYNFSEDLLTTTTAEMPISYVVVGTTSEDTAVPSCFNISEYNYSEDLLTTTTAEMPSSYVVVSTTAEVIAVPSCSNISTFIEATNLSATSAIGDVFETNYIPKRNKHALPGLWKKNVTKEKRMRGESYLGYKRDLNKVTLGVPRDARKMGPKCESTFCQKSSKRFCSLFTEDDRQNMFDNFWKELDWSGKKSLVCSLIDKIPVKQRTTDSAKRLESVVYYLKLNGEAHQVCKMMFLNSLGLKERTISYWINESQATSGIPLLARKKENSYRGLRKSTTIVNEEGVTQADHLGNFLNVIPKLSSHYCRSSSTKIYLEPVFKSKSHLYELYKQKCNDESVQPVTNCYFDKKFEEQNLSICKPKKDRCDVCCGFETNNVTKEDYDRHIEKKNAARQEKEADKTDAINGKITLLCMDVQSVKVCPKVQASAVNYKTKLCCHNYTVYNMATNEVVCYWWHECEGELQASNFASCLTEYITEKVSKSIPLIIYSDGCTSQNRNSTMANALLDLAIKEKMLITQKYLEKGHTQMECDSVHSVIEMILKNTDIHLPIQYATLTKNAKKKNPKYEVKYLSFNFFKDFSKLQRYQSIRPGKKTGDLTVTDIRQLNYETTGKIRYKLLFSDELKDLPSRPKLINNSELKPMYTEKIPLKYRKWKDLQDLKAILPKDFHSFYDALPKTE